MPIRVEIACGKTVELGGQAWVIVEKELLGRENFTFSRWAMRRVEVRGVTDSGTALICFYGDTQRMVTPPSEVYIRKEDARNEIIDRYKMAESRAHEVLHDLGVLIAEVSMQPMKELPNA